MRMILQDSGTLTLTEITLHIVSSVLLGMAIYFSYWVTHTGTAYSKKFNVSLLALTVLTSTVMTVIGNNVALSLGMVGALSIVRFRTAIKDSRDTVYIFWTIIVGICCGVGDYLVAALGSSAVFAVLLLLGRVRNDDRMLLIIRADKTREPEIEAVVAKCFGFEPVIRVKNTTPSSVEMIYEMARRTYMSAKKHQYSITDELYRLGGVDYVNIVAQSDEISG